MITCFAVLFDIAVITNFAVADDGALQCVFFGSHWLAASSHIHFWKGLLPPDDNALQCVFFVPQCLAHLGPHSPLETFTAVNAKVPKLARTWHLHIAVITNFAVADDNALQCVFFGTQWLAVSSHIHCWKGLLPPVPKCPGWQSHSICTTAHELAHTSQSSKLPLCSHHLLCSSV